MVAMGSDGLGGACILFRISSERVSGTLIVSQPNDEEAYWYISTSRPASLTPSASASAIFLMCPYLQINPIAFVLITLSSK